jgi:3-hydroxybutyryl-CoA dehydratase
MKGRTIADLAVGDAAEATQAVTRETIREFVAASGDANPIHSDEGFAADTRFGRIIAPGMLTGSFVSAVIGTSLPGPGTVYLSQSLRFLRPVYVGDQVTTRVEVVERVPDRARLRLRTTCRNQRGELVLEGEAWVLPPPAPVEYTRPPAGRAASLAPALVPAALAAELMAIWLSSGLALAGQAMALGQRALSGLAGPGRPRPDEPDPIRP